MQDTGSVGLIRSGIARRRMLGLLLSSASVALLSACGGSVAPVAPASPTSPPPANPTSVPTAVPTRAPAAAPTSAAISPTAAAAAQTPVVGVVAPAPEAAGAKSGGTLRMGIVGDVVSLDGNDFGLAFDVTYPIFNDLGQEDEKLNLSPELAESFDLSSDSRTLKLNLRKGVQFHTGREMTSDDVKWEIERSNDPKISAGVLRAFRILLTSVETPDKYTVIIKSDQPWPAIADYIHVMNILDQQTPDPKLNPVGTGPFKFQEYVQGDHLSLVKNPNYWKPGLPYLDGIRFQIFKDPQSMLVAFESGQLDAVDTPPIRDTARYQQDPNWRVVFNNIAGDSYVITFNTLQPPTNNKLLRQAMSYALDRQRIADSVLQNVGAPKNIPYYPSSPAYDQAADRFYGFDLDKAKSVLDSAGLSNVEMDFNINSTSDATEWSSISQIYQADLAKIGIKANIKPFENPTLAQMLSAVNYNGIASGTSTVGHLHAGVLSASPTFGYTSNRAGFKPDEFKSIDYAILTEVDPAKQQQAYAAWRNYFLDQQWAMVVTSKRPRVATSSKVHGIGYTRAEKLYYDETWLG
ncbi:MAG TPA: ABC transporter substrate-binding protein [Chloroflexota bacterium]|jgi:peptide/nickel transport system substrate-binding protein